MQPQKQTQVSLDGLPFQVHLNPSDINDFIRAHGVPFIHYTGMRCPVGLISKNDTRQVDECHLGCSNGFVYTKAGLVHCTPTGNSSKLIQYDPGLLTGSSLAVTPPLYYSDNDTKLVQLLQFDRMYLADETIYVPTWEIFEASETGIDRLKFPVVNVVSLLDNTGKSYSQGDFTIQDGKLYWSKPPGIDPNTGHGRVCSIRYNYRPYFVVNNLIHEIRVSTVEDPNGDIQTARLPQSAILQREYVYQKDGNDPQNINNPRHFQQPKDSGFNAR